MTVRRLNHAVLYVRDARRAAAFYREALDFEVVAEVGNGAGVFLRASGTDNHHDLGLFSVGPDAPAPQPRPRRSLPPRVAGRLDPATSPTMRERLGRLGALVGASDHGVSKSLYAQDPDGNEFEVMWEVPREDWGATPRTARSRPLDLDAELARYG